MGQSYDAPSAPSWAPDCTNIGLWPFAFEYAVHIWNHLPRRDSLRAPIEIFTQKLPSYDFLNSLHVWGYPIYVLDPKLQDGHKLQNGSRERVAASTWVYHPIIRAQCPMC